MQHDGLIVLPAGGSDFIPLRIKNANLNSAEFKCIARMMGVQSNPKRPGGVRRLNEFLRRRIKPVPDLPRPEIGDNAGHASYVVGMRVRNRDGVETADAPAPEIR